MFKKDGRLHYEKQASNLVGPAEDNRRDGFDTLIDHAPEKLGFGKKIFLNMDCSLLFGPVGSGIFLKTIGKLQRV